MSSTKVDSLEVEEYFSLPDEFIQSFLDLNTNDKINGMEFYWGTEFVSLQFKLDKEASLNNALGDLTTSLRTFKQLMQSSRSGQPEQPEQPEQSSKPSNKLHMYTFPLIEAGKEISKNQYEKIINKIPSLTIDTFIFNPMVRRTPNYTLVNRVLKDILSQFHRKIEIHRSYDLANVEIIFNHISYVESICFTSLTEQPYDILMLTKKWSDKIFSIKFYTTKAVLHKLQLKNNVSLSVLNNGEDPYGWLHIMTDLADKPFNMEPDLNMQTISKMSPSDILNVCVIAEDLADYE